HVTASDLQIIGFLGVGKIGKPMAERIASAGFQLMVYDVRSEALRPFSGRAKIAKSPVDLASSSDVILGCLASRDAFRDAILGPQGVIHGTCARTYVHIGTTGVTVVQELADAFVCAGIATVDAPMTGGVAR